MEHPRVNIRFAFSQYRSRHKWTRKWSEFISTKRYLFRVGFNEVIISAYKNLDHGWYDCWLVDVLVRIHLSNFFEWKMKVWICLNELGPNHPPISDHITEVQVLIDQNCCFMKIHVKKCLFVDMNSDHFRVHLCDDLYLVMNKSRKENDETYLRIEENRTCCKLYELDCT